MDNTKAKLIRKDGIYYILYMDKKVEIEEWEAEALIKNPAGVYDVIVAHTRKFNFNTAEDSGELNY